MYTTDDKVHISYFSFNDSEAMCENLFQLI